MTYYLKCEMPADKTTAPKGATCGDCDRKVINCACEQSAEMWVPLKVSFVAREANYGRDVHIDRFKAKLLNGEEFDPTLEQYKMIVTDCMTENR